MTAGIQGRTDDLEEAVDDSELLEDRPRKGLRLGSDDGEGVAPGEPPQRPLDPGHQDRLVEGGLAIALPVAFDTGLGQPGIRRLRLEDLAEGLQQRRADEGMEALFGPGRQPLGFQGEVDRPGNGDAGIHQNPVQIEEDRPDLAQLGHGFFAFRIDTATTGTVATGFVGESGFDTTGGALAPGRHPRREGLGSDQDFQSLLGGAVQRLAAATGAGRAAAWSRGEDGRPVVRAAQLEGSALLVPEEWEYAAVASLSGASDLSAVGLDARSSNATDSPRRLRSQEGRRLRRRSSCWATQRDVRNG